MNLEAMQKIMQDLISSPGYLQDSGWFRSMESSQVVDSEGKPIPWLTYPALDFLAGRIESSMIVFEYGSGNSTLWWSERVGRIISCEHDKEWYAMHESVMPSHITYLYRRCKGGSKDYEEEILGYENMIDILVLDGRQRVNCAVNGLKSLREAGVILWDNSDRTEYQPGYDFLVANGFNKLDFWGMGPISTRRWCTSVFYRERNCLRL